MPEFQFPVTLTSGERVDSVTAYNADAEQPVYQADSTHPHWQSILAGLRSGDPNVWSLFDVADGVMTRFKEVTERVSWDGHNVLFDGDPVHNVLAEQLERAIADGDPDNYRALALFWEKLAANPSDHSREQAFDFLARHKFQITADGDVVGYKGMRDMSDGSFTSTTKSRVPGKPSAFVNGVPVPPLSLVSQRVGDVVSMPRSEVTHDPSKSCERGLHVATRAYASGYGTVGRVTFNPAHIVSVPTVDGGEKVRVCRYTFESVVSANAPDDHETPVLRPGDTWAGDVGTRV